MVSRCTLARHRRAHWQTPAPQVRAGLGREADKPAVFRQGMDALSKNPVEPNLHKPE
jgi:hypothetical protein